jgi:hypothetical protein
VALPALATVPTNERQAVWTQLSGRFRPLLNAAMAGLLVSGLYNLLWRIGQLSTGYYVWFGIKMLLVAHIFAVGSLIVRPPSGGPQDEGRRARQMTGMTVSGVLAVVIATVALRVF